MNFTIGILLLSLLLVSDVQARNAALGGRRLMDFPETTIEVMGVIVDPPPCKINSNNPVNVEFGEIPIQVIDGSHYGQPIPAVISCPDTFKGEMKLALMGNSTIFNVNALATSNENLGLQIAINGEPMAINQFYDVNWRQSVNLTAIPLRNTKEQVATGEFTANATLIAIVN